MIGPISRAQPPSVTPTARPMGGRCRSKADEKLTQAGEHDAAPGEQRGRAGDRGAGNTHHEGGRRRQTSIRIFQSGCKSRSIRRTAPMPMASAWTSTNSDRSVRFLPRCRNWPRRRGQRTQVNRTTDRMNPIARDSGAAGCTGRRRLTKFHLGCENTAFMIECAGSRYGRSAPP
jgi:hypothetical protein